MNSVSPSAIEAGTDHAPTKAVLYCRVSSKNQLRKGDGLNSQEATSREYARRQGYEVVEVFHDNVTGKTTDRPAMDALVSYLRKHRREGVVVIIDAIDRFSRDMRGHWDLRDLLKASGGKLESPSLKFGDDPESILLENVMASAAQYQREKNIEQTKSRQRGRLLNGYWPFSACRGYEHISKEGEGRVLVRKEPVASIIQEALEGFASGQFRTQTEVRRFLESQPFFPRSYKGNMRNSLVSDLLTNPIYAGYVVRPEWDVSLRKAKHEGLIDFATFERIQERLKAKAYAPARSDIRADFPLRGAVACGCCGHQLTSCWSKGKVGTKHPYYMCFKKGCERYRKSIRRDDIEGAFADLLDQLTPSKKLLNVSRKLFKHAWDQRLAQASAAKATYERKLVEAQNQIDRLLSRIINTDSDSVVEAYEKRIEQLERDKLLLSEKQEKTGQQKVTFSELFEPAFEFLANPSKIWALGNLECRKLVLRLTFAERLHWSPDEGFRTPKITLPFKMLGDPNMGKENMAERKSAIFMFYAVHSLANYSIYPCIIACFGWIFSNACSDPFHVVARYHMR